MKNLHSARKSTACSPGTAQTATIPIPSWNKSLSPRCPKGSPPTQAVYQQRNSGIQGYPPPCQAEQAQGDHHRHLRVWAELGSAMAVLLWGWGLTAARSPSVCSPALSNLLRYWGEMKFRAASVLPSARVNKPEGRKPNEAKANKTFCMNIFVVS